MYSLYNALCDHFNISTYYVYMLTVVLCVVIAGNNTVSYIYSIFSL